MSPTIANPKNDIRSLTHTFSEVESQNGTLRQNTAGQNSPVIEWTCPRKYSQIRYQGGNHKTKFIPRYKQTNTADPDTSTISLDGDIQPIAGETELDEVPYPPVVVFDTSNNRDLTESVVVDYTANEISFDNPATTSSASMSIFPIMCEGTIQYRGLDQFGHEIAPLHEWSNRVNVFHDFDQMQSNTEIHLVGAMEWGESETLALYMDSPRQLVWQDSDYPRGQYVSTIEQRVNVTV